jgi:hypothetical protein
MAFETTAWSIEPMTSTSTSLPRWVPPDANEPKMKAHSIPGKPSIAERIRPRIPQVFTATDFSSPKSGHPASARKRTWRPDSSATSTPASSRRRSSRATVGAEKPVRRAISRTWSATSVSEKSKPITASRVFPNSDDPKDLARGTDLCLLAID